MEEDFWNGKLDWERYCDLDGMKTEDLRVFELICGIWSVALRAEFLKEDEPKVLKLLKIAQAKQTSVLNIQCF